MSNRITPRLIGAIAAVVTGTALVGCVGSADTAAQEATTTTIVFETTTTVQETTTTTTPAETTTTVAAANVPEEIREVLSAQTNEVVTDFLDRVNRVGSQSGYVALNETDPFGGSVREVLKMTETLHDWATYCRSIGWCEPGMYDPADREGRIEPLILAGEGRMYAYGNDTFYVEGVYSANTGAVAGYFYFTGFRFEVVDGQAVLIDAVAYDVSLGAGSRAA